MHQIRHDLEYDLGVVFPTQEVKRMRSIINNDPENLEVVQSS